MDVLSSLRSEFPRTRREMHNQTAGTHICELLDLFNSSIMAGGVCSFYVEFGVDGARRRRGRRHPDLDGIISERSPQ